MKKSSSRIRWLFSGPLLPIALLAFGMTGCSGKEVRVYEVAKDTSVADPHAHAIPTTDESQAEPQLTWKLPEGWTEAPRGEMRLASFKIKGDGGKEADVSIIALGGTAGGDLNNVNRWRSQVGLPPADAKELPKLAEKVAVSDAQGDLYDQHGAGASGEGTRVLAAILHRDDSAWFFKMAGDDELVAKQKPAFIGFLKSLKFTAPTGSQTELPAGHPPLAGGASGLPQGHPPVGDTAAANFEAGNTGKPQWDVPRNWVELPTTQMLLAKFSVGENGAKAEITVSSFPGDVGGLLANVNRWRGQVNLPPIDSAQLSKAVKSIKVQSSSGSLVELENPDGKSPGLIGVNLPHQGQTWFFKLVGNAKTVAHEKDAFLKFVKSTKLPG